MDSAVLSTLVTGVDKYVMHTAYSAIMLGYILHELMRFDGFSQNSSQFEMLSLYYKFIAYFT